MDVLPMDLFSESVADLDIVLASTQAAVKSVGVGGALTNPDTYKVKDGT